MKILSALLLFTIFSLHSIAEETKVSKKNSAVRSRVSKKKFKVQKEGIKQELSHRFQSEYESGRQVAGGTKEEHLDDELNKKVQGKYDQERDIAKGEEETEIEEGVSPVDNQKVRRWKYSPKEDSLD